MAEAAPQGKVDVREHPLSPHLQIWRWTITMAASIAHRATGMALYAGTAFLAWWLIAMASGADAYDNFIAAASHPLGRVVLFGFVWSISFHLLNGVRHFAWDLGHGFEVPTAKRTAALPEAPTVAEAGVTGYEAGIWWGLMGPAGVPPGIVGKLNAEVGAIVREPDSVKWFTAQASDPASSAPDEFSKLIVADVAKWRKVAKSAGIGPS